MSSATLTEGARREKRTTRRPPPPPSPAALASDSAAGLRPWHFFLVASALLATVTVLVMRGQPPAQLLFAAATVAAAGYAGHSLYRTLSPLVTDNVGEDATMVAGRTRAALERDKMLTLRAIKELEFDRAMGKVSAKDFDEMAARLRTRALSLMKQLDAEGGYRELIERELSARLQTSASSGSKTGSRASAPAPAPPVTGQGCTCGTVNDLDATFCKRCGTKLTGTTA
jgi:hypothetical protein